MAAKATIEAETGHAGTHSLDHPRHATIVQSAKLRHYNMYAEHTSSRRKLASTQVSVPDYRNYTNSGNDRSDYR
ncbi:MAG: hypothetical protein AMXMBFR81_31320 [Chthonomonas sp.]